MTYLLVASNVDEASMNIKSHLLELADWSQAQEFEGCRAFAFDGYFLAEIGEHHLYYDDVDVKAREVLGIEVDVVIFLSRHKSASGLKSLTVHPIGNYFQADYGGRPGTLVPSHPALMTQALRILKQEAKAAGITDEFQVSFEATHHGPYLSSPTFYIEIGSSEKEWKSEDAGMVIARTVLSLSRPEEGAGDTGFPAALGVGGGHYVPRQTDIALARRISIGHMVPSYALGGIDKTGEVGEKEAAALTQAIEKTPGVKYVYFHKKGMKKSTYRILADWFEKRGLESVSSSDLGPLD